MAVQKLKNILESSGFELSPTSFIDYKAFLQSIYTHLKNQNEKYSFKAFAVDMGFSESTIMHQIVQGYRPLTLKTAKKIADALDLSGTDKKYFEALVEFSNAKTVGDKEELFTKMIDLKSNVLASEYDKACLEYFSEWFHPVVRELVGWKDFQYDPMWIADTIQPRIRPQQAKKSLELLEQLNLIAFDKAKDRWVQTSQRISTGSQVRGIAFMRYHQMMIDLAKTSLDRFASKERNVTALTVSVDEAAYQKIKLIVEETNAKVMQIADECGNVDNVYQLNIQLFPFSKK
ncbi:MAG: TIGR02147 family protein [Oligoflexales bacterium]